MRVMQAERRINLRCICYGLVGLLLAGCGTLGPQLPASQTNVPTPTVASFFRAAPTTAPSPPPTSSGQLQVSPTVLTAKTPTPTAPAPTRTADQIATIALYDETLNADWSAERSDKVKYNVASTAFVHGGKKAIVVTPTDDFGRLFLTVRKDARKIYPRDQVLGISFWLNGGENSIGTGDLAVAVTGSNQYTYWVADDTSVKINAPVTADSPLFSETRLYHLHINRSIPPNTWAEVVLWLDAQVYDPDYTYVTGMYIKNDKGFLYPYYIDDVQILVLRAS